MGEHGKNIDITQATVEAQLIGSLLDQQLDFVAGYFYATSEPDGYNASGSFNAAALAPGGGAEIDNTSTAFYAQGTLHLGLLSDTLQRFRFTAGIRRTEDEIGGALHHVLLGPCLLRPGPERLRPARAPGGTQLRRASMDHRPRL
ncbi:MAG: TonB-dependent receptor [Gammaproteobacteria bacterium]|nr:TonB-dependent receptor [Gammaproteobacteria bacterium]